MCRTQAVLAGPGKVPLLTHPLAKAQHSSKAKQQVLLVVLLAAAQQGHLTVHLRTFQLEMLGIVPEDLFPGATPAQAWGGRRTSRSSAAKLFHTVLHLSTFNLSPWPAPPTMTLSSPPLKPSGLMALTTFSHISRTGR